MNALLLNPFRVMILLSVALLVVGIFKPEWVRFQQKQLSRITIIAVAIGLLVLVLARARFTMLETIMPKPFLVAKCLERLCMQSTILRDTASQERNPVMQAPAMMNRHRRVFAIW